MPVWNFLHQEEETGFQAYLIISSLNNINAGILTALNLIDIIVILDNQKIGVMVVLLNMIRNFIIHRQKKAILETHHQCIEWCKIEIVMDILKGHHYIDIEEDQYHLATKEWTWTCLLETFNHPQVIHKLTLNNMVTYSLVTDISASSACQQHLIMETTPTSPLMARKWG